MPVPDLHVGDAVIDADTWRRYLAGQATWQEALQAATVWDPPEVDDARR